jgi:hypothetical protein
METSHSLISGSTQLASATHNGPRRNSTAKLTVPFLLTLAISLSFGQITLGLETGPAFRQPTSSQEISRNTRTEFVIQELRYHAPGASDVYLVWGINGWQSVPESIRPPGTYLDDKTIMRTRLSRTGDTFTATLHVPRGARLDYSFMRTTSMGCGSTDTWQSDVDENGQPFSTTADSDNRIERHADLSTQTRTPKGDFAIQELQYRAPEANEVYLVWGINGWQPVPDLLRPPETYLDEKKIMRTRLSRKGDLFTTTLTIPRNTRISYGFIVAIRNKDGRPDTWRSEFDSGGLPFIKEVGSDGRLTLESPSNKTAAAKPDQLKAWLAGEAPEVPLATQEFFYHAPEAGEVWFVWSVEGGKPLPETVRPPSTLMREGLMHTRMELKNHIFEIRVRIPLGIRLEYSFLVTMSKTGTPVAFREAGAKTSYSIEIPADTLDLIPNETPITRQRCTAWLKGAAIDTHLVERELSYRSARSSDIWIRWGIDGWQAIPELYRPPGTIMNYGLMYTPMVRKGHLLMTTLQVPPGASVNYEYVTIDTDASVSANQGDSKQTSMLVSHLTGRTDVALAATLATLEQHKAWPSGRLADLALVAQEIRYRIAGAEEVWLVWGINGWQTIPEAARPPGTRLNDNNVMQSRMVRNGDTFATTMRVPPGTVLDYKFLTTKTRRGTSVRIWQDFNGQDFRKLVRVNGSLEEKATVTVVTPEERKAWLAGQTADLPLVKQEIRYRAPGASDVWLTWGIEDWQTIPEAIRPPDTVLNNGRMQTRLVREGHTFTSTVRLPPGTRFDYGFRITRTEEGATVNIRQEKSEHSQPLSKVVLFDDRIEIQSTAWLSVQAADRLSLVAQEIRYRIAGAEEVWLVWGINGWQTIPEAARPPDTRLNDNNVMQSRMARKGDTFATTVQVPRGTRLNFKFLITKTNRGVPINIWQDFNGQDFDKLVRVSGSLEEKATVAVVTSTQRQAWLSGQIADLPLVTQTIRYHAPGAAEVWLEWGFEDWHPIPETTRPTGTVLKDGRMCTALGRKGSTFATTIQAPPGTMLDFAFRITKTDKGTTLDIRHEKDEEGRILSKVLAFDGQTDIYSHWKAGP